jgi:hypothetical protein
VAGLGQSLCTIDPSDWMYGLDARGSELEDLWLICGELGLRATVHALLQYPWVLFTSRVVAATRVGGA